mmetsp:Transcript_25460/g.71026  ORF Transcript_25460/g.71026 Transcript_25460/m.71026 type:complete len:100 (+) Transcript_25460:910-1209(+)
MLTGEKTSAPWEARGSWEHIQVLGPMGRRKAAYEALPSTGARGTRNCAQVLGPMGNKSRRRLAKTDVARSFRRRARLVNARNSRNSTLQFVRRSSILGR